MTSSLTDDSRLEDAREWLRDRLGDGAACPCCTQFAKVYRRKISAVSARVLIAMYNKAGTEFVDLPKLGKALNLGGRGDETKARYWGLIEEKSDAVRDDGSSRVGQWALTNLGASFVRGTVSVPKYAKIYDGRCLGLDGPEVSIRDALGTRFNYNELMAGV